MLQPYLHVMLRTSGGKRGRVTAEHGAVAVAKLSAAEAAALILWGVATNAGPVVVYGTSGVENLELLLGMDMQKQPCSKLHQ